MLLRLNEDEAAVDDVFGAFFANECPIERVRAAEASGHDAALWDKIAQTGAPGMALPAAIGGGGGDLATVAVVAGHLGRHLAPVPVIEHIVTARLLGRIEPRFEDLAGVVAGTTVATLAPQPTRGGLARLVPAGSVADIVVAMREDELVAHTAPPPARLPNTADLPLAHRDLTDATVLETGDRAQQLHARAVSEWQALMAVALAGLGRRAVEIGVDYTKERYQFDVLIGTFQSLQHGLATAVTHIEGAQFLASRAVWALDHDRAEGPRLAAMAFLFAAEAAQQAAATSLQYHGGYGFSEEYDIQLYYRRAKGWALQYGDPGVEYQRLAAMTLPAAAVT